MVTVHAVEGVAVESVAVEAHWRGGVVMLLQWVCQSGRAIAFRKCTKEKKKYMTKKPRWD